MYGKHFVSMYTGSMVGAGLNVFAVWGYVIANMVKGHVELNPTYLALVLGGSESDIVAAIDYLLQPDPNSRSPEHEGRRLIRDGQFQYFIPTAEKYRLIRNEEERREYMRKYMQDYRKRADVNNVNTCKPQLAMLAHAEPEPEPEPEEETSIVVAKADDATIPQVDIIFKAWNEAATAQGWCMARVLSKKRRTALNARLRDTEWDWRAALDEAAGSAFLKGENDNGWTATIDWFLRPETVMKIREGQYSGKVRDGPDLGLEARQKKIMDRWKKGRT